MLYLYDNKIYVKPFSRKIVEVNITPKGDEYSIEPTNSKIELNDEISAKMQEISIEEAYKLLNKEIKPSQNNKIL